MHLAYVYDHLCACVYAYVCVRMCTLMQACTCVCMRVHVQMCAYVYASECIMCLRARGYLCDVVRAIVPMCVCGRVSSLMCVDARAS